MHQEPYDFFMLRRAAMPTSVLTSLHEQCGEDFQKWETALLDRFQSEDFGQALYLASPSLFAAVDQYDKQAPENARRKVLFSLYKYLSRMSSRATPFGLFAVTGAGLLSERSKLSGPTIHKVKKTIRLQVSALTHIAGWIENQKTLGRQQLFVNNTSLHQTPTGYRYVETKKNHQTIEQIVSEVERSPELNLVVAAAKIPHTKIELINILREKLTLNQSAALIEDMIDSQMLLSELSANATGNDFEDRIKAYLDECCHQSTEVQRLCELIYDLSGKDSASSLLNIARELTSIIPALSSQQLFRAQLSTAATGLTLSKKTVVKLAADFAAVKGLLSSRQQLGALHELKQKFRQHYGERQVPLSELLESEMGMQYAGVAMQAGRPPTLLRQLEFTPSSSQQAFSNPNKQRLLDRALGQQLYKVEILESDLKTLTGQSAEQPGFFLLGQMLTSSAKDLDRGNFHFYLKAAGGQSGLELMARFAQDDPLLASGMLDATRELVDNDKENLHAEIAHIPDSKTAAVLGRPHLWPYEIPYLSYSVMASSKQIAVNDILVSISQDDSFVLTSEKRLKTIIPHNTTAHNYRLGLPVYQFLSDVANQHSQAMAWDWENLEYFSFLPRVVFRQLILSPAQWNLSGETRRTILAMLDGDVHWRQLQNQFRIPRLIQIYQGDNELLIDLENRFARTLLKTELQKTDHLQIQEYLQTDNYQPVKDHQHRFAHELVLAFKPSLSQAPWRPKVQRKEQRLFHLGSRWFYVKIFLPVSRADQLLAATISGICQELIREEHLKMWFYVRYFDPSHHLRVRLHLTTQHSWHLVLARLQAALESSPCQDVIEKIQTDTYERELERYHSLGFENVELIFYKDSLAGLRVISILEHDSNDQRRWHAALYAVDAMLNDFGMATKHKADFAKTSYQSFLSEFGQDQALTWQLDRKYRAYRSQIRQTLTGQGQFPIMLDSCFRARTEHIRKLPTAEISIAEISSYVHMCLNRILESNHRKQEMILFHFLNKYYQSADRLCTKELFN